MKDHTKSQHSQRVHGPGSLNLSPREEAHGTSQSTSRTPTEAHTIQRAKAEVMSCLRVDCQNRKQTADPKDQFQR